MIKFAVLCLCVVNLLSVSIGNFTRKEVQAARNGLSTSSSAHAPQSAGSLSQGRQRPLFARRGQHERQKLRVLKHRRASVSLNDHPPPPEVVSKPTRLKCSQLTQSCLPKSGCCDPCTTCHCRFFRSICFCRRTREMKPWRQK